MKMANRESQNGVVNHGFSVEFSSEEDVSDVDLRQCPFTSSKCRTLSFDSLTETELTAAAILDGSVTSPTKIDRKCNLTHEPYVNNQVCMNTIVSDTDDGGNKGQTFAGSTALPTLPLKETQSQNQKGSSVDKNVQTNSMLPASVQVEAASLIPNGKKPSLEITKSSLSDQNDEFSNSKESRFPKEYFRDVRLSLDASKPGVSSLPFKSSVINNRKSYSVQSSYASNGALSYDSCVTKAIEQYKIFFKYVFERPLFCFSIWAMFYIFWGDDALPGGSLFALTVLELTALLLGHVAEVFQLPGLIGMAAAGLILRNVPYVDVAKDLDLSLSSPLRSVSIVILLVRGALGVNPVNILKFKNIIPPLVIGSCVLEAVAASVAVYLILDFPVEWASLMGCIMSAMSGVAVLPYLASTEKLLSSKADSCSLSPHCDNVIAIARTACGLDAMIAICMAEVALGFIFAEGNVGEGVVKGAVEVIMGGVFGVAWGLLAGFLLDETSSNEKRSMTIFSCGVMSLIGFPKIGYPRAGPLAVFAGVLITSTIWKKKQIGGSNNEQLNATFTLIWYIFQPLLFSIIGARSNFDRVDWSIVWKGLICLAISLFVRFITTFCMCTATGKLSFRERIYICIAWIPKGTVQAALGPAALDTVLSSKNLASPDYYEDLAFKIMNLSAVSFITAATIGCLCLKFIGPKLLSHR